MRTLSQIFSQSIDCSCKLLFFFNFRR